MAKMTPVNMSVAAVHVAAGLSSDVEMPAVPEAADLDNSGGLQPGRQRSCKPGLPCGKPYGRRSASGADVRLIPLEGRRQR
jgi:hypothetical protein